MSDYKQTLKNIKELDSKNTNIVFVTWDFNKNYTDQLEEKNEKYLKKQWFTNIEKYRVPWVLEIPAMIKRIVNKKDKVDLIIIFWVVIRWETTHYDIVSEQQARAIMNLSIEYSDKVAMINWILTCENKEQVKTRVEKSEVYSISWLNLLWEIKKIYYTKK